MPKFDWQGWIKTLWPVVVAFVAVIVWMERVDSAVNFMRLELQKDIENTEVTLLSSLDNVQSLYIPLSDRLNEIHTQLARHESLHWHAPMGERVDNIDKAIEEFRTDVREIRQDVKTLLRRSNGH